MKERRIATPINSKKEDILPYVLYSKLLSAAKEK